MKKKTFRFIWAMLMIALVSLVIFLSLWYVPYQISHDQHMVDTINDRALEYEHPEGVITDFTEAEIMMLDAQEEYENKVWKLDHQELYWYSGIVQGIIGSVAVLLIAFLGYKMMCEYMEYNDLFPDTLDEDIDFNDSSDVRMTVDEMSDKHKKELLILADEIHHQEIKGKKSTFPEEVVEP